MIHAKVPLLNHHTSGVRMEWYRDDIEEHLLRDPYPKLKQLLLENNFTEERLLAISNQSETLVNQHYKDALKEKEPDVDELYQHIFAPTKVIEENGNRSPSNKEPTVMVDSALFAIREILASDKRCLLYGQDVGARLGGVFREAATLAQQFGDHRVFNTPIQEAFIIGSTAGMSAVGLKPISRSYYLSNGKWPISMILRVPIGAYGSGGPYHSSSIESIVTNIIGIKVVYPSTGADLKGLIKAAYLDPNPVLILEHKGLYWSKIPGTEGARTIEPDSDYIIPIGNARIVLKADNSFVNSGTSVVVISYGRGIYWTLEAAKFYNGQIEVLDLRTLNPLDEKQIFKLSKLHGKVLIVTEEPNSSSFSLGLAGKIQKNCFEYLDAPVEIVGSENTPAIPLNENLEYACLPKAQKIKKILSKLLEY